MDVPYLKKPYQDTRILNVLLRVTTIRNAMHVKEIRIVWPRTNLEAIKNHNVHDLCVHANIMLFY